MKTNPTPRHTAERDGERGAALITALLISTLLLLAGGALIVKTSGSVAVSFGSTAEMQAYYSAEAGLQAALNVLRGNVQNGAGTPATFRNAVDLDGGNLNSWLAYNKNINGTQAKTLGTNAYSVLVTDPDGTVAPAEPSRLVITSTGYGPRGSRKQVEMTIRPSSALEVPGAVTLRGSPGGGGLVFNLGTSNGRTFLTDDPTKPVFITTNGTDGAQVINWIAGDDKSKTQFGDPPTGDTSAGTAKLPSFLESPLAAETLVQDLMAQDNDDDNITIYDGDADIQNGEGILLVTGSLKLGGNSNWTGIILVLGEGEVTWGGQGEVHGAMFVAKYDRKDLTKDFEAPIFNINGAGKSSISYETDAVNEALKQMGFRVLGVQEK
jgi:hypothetical protein